MDRCPACQARLRQATQCRRCGSDLALPINIGLKAEKCCSQSLYYLQNKQYKMAQEKIQQAISLHSTPLFQQISGFIGCLSEKK